MTPGNLREFQFTDLESEALLLVEGINDARFFAAILGYLQRTDIQISAVGGKSNFRGFLQYTLIRARGFAKLRRLGIVRDADRHPTGAFQSVQTALSAAGLPNPTQPWEFFRKDILTVSIAILPDGKSEGNLEELCLRSIQDQPEMSCIEQYIGCIADAGGAIAENQLAIAKVCAYLAVGPFSKQTHRARPSVGQRREPGLRLGESAENGVWDWNSRGFAQVVDYLNDF